MIRVVLTYQFQNISFYRTERLWFYCPSLCPLHRLVVSKVQALRRCVSFVTLDCQAKGSSQLGCYWLSVSWSERISSFAVCSQSLSSSSLRSTMTTCGSFFFLGGQFAWRESRSDHSQFAPTCRTGSMERRGHTNYRTWQAAQILWR